MKKEMLYKARYKRRSDRNPEKWTEFSEVLNVKDLYSLLKWLESCEDQILISVEPYKG